MEPTETACSQTGITGMMDWAHLSSRALLAITGPDRLDFLNGLITQSIPENAPFFSALLLHNGRFFTDFFGMHLGETLLLDCAKAHHADLCHFLTPYSLLHNVYLHDATHHYAVCAAIGPEAGALINDPLIQNYRSQGSIVYTDPRNALMGLRACVPYAIWNELPTPIMNPCNESAYHRQRIQLGIAEGAYDLIHRQSIILEYGYHNHHAISWTKGCYMGQELMARTFHRGMVRKKIYSIHLTDGHFPESGSELFALLSDGTGVQRVGWMGSHCDASGLAVIHESALSPQLVLYTDSSMAGKFSVTLSM